MRERSRRRDKKREKIREEKDCENKGLREQMKRKLTAMTT